MLGARDEIKRVLLTTDAVGGVWTHALELAAGLGDVGIETVLVSMGPRPGDVQRTQALGLPSVELIETDLPLDWLAPDRRASEANADALQTIARENGADLVHLHAPAVAGAGHWPVPLVTAVHSCVGTWWQAVDGGPLPPDLSWRTDLTREALAVTDAVVAPSRSFATAASSYYGFAHITPVLNGRTPPQNLAQTDERQGVLVAGRLWDRGKDIETLDRAAAQSGILIAAAGPTTAPHGETCRVDALELLGELDPVALLRRMSETAVLVSAAVYEPFGLTVLEGAQAGAALVLTDIPTHRELWDGAALLVPPRRPELLAEALQRVTGDADLRRDLARRARERSRRYGAARMTNGMLTVYRRALAKHRRKADRAGGGGKHAA
jgi:glycosyltransferase involved in cell wall biosynthesis